MTKWLIVAGLVFLNVLLGAAVFHRIAERSAQAQGIGAARTDVASVAGTSNGQSVIYMLDVNTGQLIALRLDVTNRQIGRVAALNVAEQLRRIQ